MATTAAIVLAGGRSSRMGTAKADLEWHGSTLLRRVTGLAARGADGPVVVVRAPGQPLPPLPPAVEVVDDPTEGCGPLQGIAVGLRAVAERADHAFVCSTDLPHLHPAFVREVLRAGRDVDVALPVVGGHRQPLAACYRTALGDVAARLLSGGATRPVALLDGAAVRLLDEPALHADVPLRAADPDLRSVQGLNTPEEYAAARALPAPDVVVQRLGLLASRTEDARVGAATLGAAAAEVGVVLDRHVVGVVQGEVAGRAPDTPLAAGDTVAFLSAHAGG